MKIADHEQFTYASITPWRNCLSWHPESDKLKEHRSCRERDNATGSDVGLLQPEQLRRRTRGGTIAARDVLRYPVLEDAQIYAGNRVAVENEELQYRVCGIPGGDDRIDWGEGEQIR